MQLCKHQMYDTQSYYPSTAKNVFEHTSKYTIKRAIFVVIIYNHVKIQVSYLKPF